MHETFHVTTDRAVNYKTLKEQLPHFLNADDTIVTNLANVSALLNVYLDDINWVGFYLFSGEKLVLGPFQGLPACTEIAIGRGVCGLAAKARATQIVADVTTIDNHIFCDPKSRSEIVVPIVKDGELFGVLDVDSPTVGRFTEADQALLEDVVALVVDILP